MKAVNTLLELPDELPGWAKIRVDDKYVTSLWLDEYDVAPSPKWGFAIIARVDGNIAAFVYADEIRRASC